MRVQILERREIDLSILLQHIHDLTADHSFAADGLGDLVNHPQPRPHIDLSRARFI